MEKFVRACDTALRINDTQKGEAVIVLLHGYLENLDIWEGFAGLLAHRYRVISLDLPGLGISEVKSETHTMDFLACVVKGVLDGLGVGKCFMTGHSMGGYVAQAFAAKYPEMLQGLILFHSTPDADTEEKKEDRRREKELIRSNKKELLASMFAPKGFAEQNHGRLRDEIEGFEELATINDDEGIIAILNGLIERPDRNEMLRKLKVPQLFIFGRHDALIPVEAAEKIIAAQPQAEVAWLENSGHMGFIEEPEASVEIISSFIEKILNRNKPSTHETTSN